MKRLLLLRHGQTLANAQWRYCGWSDVPLSEAGVLQLQELRRTRRYPPLDGFSVCTSGLLRTEQTLRLLYGDVPHFREPDLREIHFGDFEGHSYDELKDAPAYQAWLSGDPQHLPCPNGESGEQMARRVMACLMRLLSSEDCLCAVTHGGVIAAVMARLFPQEGKNRYEWQPGNGCGYLVTLSGARSYLPVPFPEEPEA